MSSPLVLALDVGTSSTRTALFDDHAHRILPTTAQQKYRLHTTPDGGAELDPAVLLRAARHCLDQTMRVHRSDPALRRRPVAGIGVSSFWHSLLGVNAKGDPVTRVFTWADSRCRADAAALREKFGEKTLHARTGCMVRASFWPAKLKWLRRTQPKVWERVRQWMSPAEWLQLKLTGEAHCALGMATGTGLFNPATMQWDAALLKTCGVTRDRLRPLSDEPLPVGGSLAREFPELRGVPWFPGIGDGAASNLGSGATRPGLAAINFGTSGALRVIRESGIPRAPFGVSCYRVDARRYLVGGAVSNAGNLRAWCLRELNLSDEAEIDSELAHHPEPVRGLTVLPFWTAERAPKWNEEQPSMIVGLTHHTTARDLLQAITEASYQRIARIAELIFAEEKTKPKLIISGGILRSAQALQRFADVLGEPLYPSEEMEASIRGAAIFVLEKLGGAAPPLHLGRPVRPRPRYAKLFAAAREKQRKLEDSALEGWR